MFVEDEKDTIMRMIKQMVRALFSVILGKSPSGLFPAKKTKNDENDKRVYNVGQAKNIFKRNLRVDSMILCKKTELKEIQAMQPQFFDDMVKIVIDEKRERIAVNMEMHSDLGMELYDDGSDEQDLYGANIYYDDHHIEWSSTLNIRQNRKIQNGTYGRIITDEDTIMRLTDIVNQWIG